MSTEFPPPDPDRLPTASDGIQGPTEPLVWPSLRRRKFQHRYGRHLLFFLLTLFTTSFTTAWQALLVGLNPLPLFTWPMFLEGLKYSAPVLLILSAHEFGHYFACRYHDVDATLPYFLPAPLPLTGTLGAVIRIKEPFPSKRALFDIGVAGPLGGFIVLVPLLYWGITMSELGPAGQGGLSLGEPLLWKFFEWLHFGSLPESMDVYVHPLGLAAWWGMLATALNLLPFGQLDGGHIMYASVGRRAVWLSGATLGTVILLSLRSSSWFAMAAMMTAMAFMFGFRHPKIYDEHEPLDPGRQAVALLAAVVFVLCFTPVPIELIG